MPAGVELAAPLWLLALPIVAAVLVALRWPWWRPALTPSPRGRGEARRLAIRLAWCTLVVLALAQATIVRPLVHQATALVLDTSASMTSVRDQLEDAALNAERALPQGDQLSIVASADGARVEESPTDRPVFTRLGTTLGDQASDLAAGLRLGAGVLPTDYARRVVLASDGRQTRGDALAVARELAGRGLSVDVLPLGALAMADLRLESVSLSATAYEGEVSTLSARVSTQRPTAATLWVWRDDGQLVLNRPVALSAGEQELAVPLPRAAAAGAHRYRVEVIADDASADASPRNNALGAVQRVVGAPRVLIVAAQPEAAAPLLGALRAGGAQVQVTPPANVPTDLAGWSAFESVVLANVEADALPAGTLDQLEAFVRDLGHGLAMTGGSHAFGAGDYAGTAIERALPVYMDVRGRGRQPRVALALVIDKSGSMAGSKMEMAKEASIRSVRLLGPQDQAAVLAFDSVPQWVTMPTPLDDRGREQVERAIGGVFAGGGTEIFPAVAAGFEALRGVDADTRHLILLTDGRSASTGDYGQLMDQMRGAHMTLSSVAVGTDADQQLLEALARAGRGRSYVTTEPSEIPQVFTRETLMATRALLVDQRFVPAIASNGPLLRGLTATPLLDGYVGTTAKERAEVVLVAPEGDPVLAAWQYGAGRTVAWTSDVVGPWSLAWAGSPATTALWGNVLSWLLPAQDSGPLTVRVEARPQGGATIIADVGAQTAVERTTAHVVGPDGSTSNVALLPAGPGQYQAAIDAPASGAYVVQVSQAGLRSEAGWVAPYPAEFRATGLDSAFLQQLATAGGGRVLDNAEQAVRPAERPAQARWPLWPLLAILAALTWPLDIGLRRFGAVAPRLATLGRLRVPRPTRVRSEPEVAMPASTTDLPAATARLLERKRARRRQN